MLVKNWVVNTAPTFLIMLNNILQMCLKRAIRETAEVTGELIGNRIGNRITKITKNLQQNYS